MATYDAKCPRCGDVQEYQRTISERDKTPDCDRCAVPMDRMLAAPRGYVDKPAAG